MTFVFEHVKESEAGEVLALYRSLVGTPILRLDRGLSARSDVDFDLSARRCSVCGTRKPGRWRGSFPSMRIQR